MSTGIRRIGRFAAGRRVVPSTPARRYSELDRLCVTWDDVHVALRDQIRRFAVEEVAPGAHQRDIVGEGVDRKLFKRFGDLGLLGITVPEEDGGSGMDSTAVCVVHEELSREDAGLCLAYLAHTLLFVNNFYNNANPEQRARYLAPTMAGEMIGGMGMSEPDYGTDVLGMQTTAVRKGDKYIVNGTKVWITNGPSGDVFLFYAKIDGRVSALVVDRSCPGFSTSAKIDKCGMRGSEMGYLHFEDCEVPVANLLGEEGGGIRCMMQNLEVERLALAAQSTGIAMKCLEIMLTYSKERKAFGKPIADFGQVQKYIGDAFADTAAARSFLYNVASQVKHGQNSRTLTDAVKLHCARTGKRVADDAMQVLGGAGYSRMYPVERLWRDAKLIEIGGGTLESHQKNITRDLIRAL
eukprot:TRINITY_DN1250_c0_g1_i1.p2 TRINITY_DN1250_c0_g1~~TRINITY_DN1250_c0_g1_i1.p2  ORF type:complete len:423 (+),score=109.64 TRINITY_DN1250_c0_g1_i1:44-1270(+)